MSASVADDFSDLSWCPRCGLESWDRVHDRCPVCGLEGDAQHPPRLTITVVVRAGDQASPALAPHVVFRRALPPPKARRVAAGESEGELPAEREPEQLPPPAPTHEHYLCFGVEEAGTFLPNLGAELDFTVLVNGRPRPFARDLWLSLLQFFIGADATTTVAANYRPGA